MFSPHPGERVPGRQQGQFPSRGTFTVCQAFCPGSPADDLYPGWENAHPLATRCKSRELPDSVTASARKKRGCGLSEAAGTESVCAAALHQDTKMKTQTATRAACCRRR